MGSDAVWKFLVNGSALAVQQAPRSRNTHSTRPMIGRPPLAPYEGGSHDAAQQIREALPANGSALYLFTSDTFEKVRATNEEIKATILDIRAQIDQLRKRPH